MLISTPLNHVIWTLTFSPFLYQLCVRVFNSLQLSCRTYVLVCTMYHVLHKEIDMIDKTYVVVFSFCLFFNKWISCKYSSLNKGKRETSWIFFPVCSTIYCKHFHDLYVVAYIAIVHTHEIVCLLIFSLLVHYANDVIWKSITRKLKPIFCTNFEGNVEKQQCNSICNV